MAETRADIYTRITNGIVAAVEAGTAEWRMPWHHDGSSNARPMMSPWQGISGHQRPGPPDRCQAGGYSSDVRGTYRRWAARGCPVRKGRKPRLLCSGSRLAASSKRKPPAKLSPKTSKTTILVSSREATDKDGSLREELPPITTFLNRLLALVIALQNTLFAAFEELLEARVEAAITAGAYDVGLETITATSLKVCERRSIWCHAESSAETRLFTIERKVRNKPLALNEALAIRDGRLMVNGRSGRAAVEVSAPSLVHDDGEIERRVRLIRPMERPAISVDALEKTEWKKADREGFARAWVGELAEIPVFTTNTFHLVTGLLLPIWRRLPDDSCRVYRLQTDDGERIIGRMLSAADAATVCRNLGHDDAPTMTPEDAWDALNEGKVSLHLADGLSLRRCRVMHEHRAELVGFTSGMVERLKADGLIAEIIAWTLRLFVPMGLSGRTIFAQLMERHPLTHVTKRGQGNA